MRPYILPIAGSVLIIVGIALVLISPGAPSAVGIALALEVVGVLMLGIFIGRGLLGKK
ncbi:hypothetical protein [Lysinibacter sp. HNR]|uniref:hypothetical protein n=1 Tax=Lysinibacter sp. HNR TaxID=3031408 RepID=UPI00243578AB|nr:hypothetical protein [Lysinibacter sp. HNR]WGD38329.1 hypothetical protein FrondiHNR_05310 [Lysinibacter sp. HNR]